MTLPPTAITITCVAGGVAFALFATLLHMKKGNTISDIMRSQHLTDQDALRVEILNKVKISTTIPVVALYIIAAFVAFGLPAYIASQDDKSISQERLPQIITLNGDLVRDRTKQAYVYPVHMKVNESGNFGVDIFYKKQNQLVNIESPFFDPVTLKFKLNTDEKYIVVDYSGAGLQSDTIPIDTSNWTANLSRKIELKETEFNFCNEVNNTVTEARAVEASPVAPPPIIADVSDTNSMQGMQ